MKAVRWRYGLMICALAASLIPGAAQAAGSAAAGQTFLWLAIILVLGRLSGFVERFGIPGVLGELLVGVLLGNFSLMGIQFFEKIGAPFYAFHDRDVAPEGKTLKESHANLDAVVKVLKEEQARSGVKLLWGTANLFSNPRYVHGAATSPNLDVFATGYTVDASGALTAAA